jgi:hypothetical protein
MNQAAERAMAVDSTSRRTSPRGKIGRILAELARGATLHRFQAERLGDHVLHSTVCKIQRYGILVEREWTTVPGYAGHPTRVCRYWLNNEQRNKAARLLGIGGG